VHSDDRGTLMEVLRADDPFFAPIKQTTYTEAHPGVIKAFHWHRRQMDVWFVSTGAAQVVLYDLRPESRTHRHTNVVILGERAPALAPAPLGGGHWYPRVREEASRALLPPARGLRPRRSRRGAHSARRPDHRVRLDDAAALSACDSS